MSAKIHKLSTHNESGKYKPLFAKLHTCLEENLKNRLTFMFNGADDTLFHLAETADSNEEQSQYFDTMRLLRLEKNHIENQFIVLIHNLLKPAIQEDENTETPFDADELSLVDQETMEEMVAISTMNSKATNLFGDLINHLEARLEFLSMKTDTTCEKTALHPKHICEAFQDALSEIELSTKTKLILYKLFDQEVSSQLEELYSNLNKILIDEGILPQIKHEHISKKAFVKTNNTYLSESPESLKEEEIISSKVALSSNNITHSPSINIPNTGSHNIVNTSANLPQAQINQVINDFIHGSAASTARSSANSSTKYYDKRDVITALSNLQNNYDQFENPNGNLDQNKFKQILISKIGSSSGGAITKQVNHVDEKTIDFVEMLFNAISEDQSISEVIINLIMRLQIPIIKVAMLDQQFFSSDNHPARLFLNLIVDASRSITSKEDELYPELENIVNEIINNFEADVVTFSTAIDQLNKHINNNDSEIDKNEKETQKKVLQEHARSIVLKEIQTHVKDKMLPKSAHPIVLKNWSTLMFHRYLRYGKDSIQWLEATNLLQLLISSVQPVKTKRELDSLKHNHMELVETLKDYLYETKQDKNLIDEAIKSLITTYSEIICSTRIESYETAIENTPDIETETINDASLPCESVMLDAAINNTGEFSNNEYDETARNKIAALPSSVKPGVWFEIYTSKDTAVRRLKLSVVIMEEAKLIFVDRHGIKILEKDAEEFSEELSLEKSKVIADHSAFDNALSKVITSLAANA